MLLKQINTLDIDGKLWEGEVDMRKDTLNPTSLSKYQLSLDSRWGLVPGGKNSKCQSMEIGKLGCKVHLGVRCSLGVGREWEIRLEKWVGPTLERSYNEEFEEKDLQCVIISIVLLFKATIGDC